MNILALWAGKLTYKVLRVSGRRGAALPGLVVEKLSHSFLSKSLSQLPEGVIIVTGTNGKTTTTKMLTHVLGANARVLTNPTGSNFTRGIVASIVEQSSLSGALPFDIAVLELDEAYAVKFIQQHKPRGVIVLNVMRDQMDRFAEIDMTAKMLAKVVAASQEFVVLNRDDPRVLQLQKSTNNKVLFFGVADHLRKVFLQDDELHGKNAVVKNSTKAQVELVKLSEDGTVFEVDGKQLSVTLSSSGAHNAQNAAAVLATTYALGIDAQSAVSLLAQVGPAFGRGESFNVGKKKIILQLVKNPGGFRHAILSHTGKGITVEGFAVNDNYADGRDVSWLWDVNFKSVVSPAVITGGARATDMALRLKYDDIQVAVVEPDLKDFLDTALGLLKDNQTGILYTTYTAMLTLREHLSKITEVEKV